MGDDAAEQIEAQFVAIAERTGEQVPQSGLVQALFELSKEDAGPLPSAAPTSFAATLY